MCSYYLKIIYKYPTSFSHFINKKVFEPTANKITASLPFSTCRLLTEINKHCCLFILLTDSMTLSVLSEQKLQETAREQRVKPKACVCGFSYSSSIGFIVAVIATHKQAKGLSFSVWKPGEAFKRKTLNRCRRKKMSQAPHNMLFPGSTTTGVVFTETLEWSVMPHSLTDRTGSS